jgi:hypothetical protein
MNSKFGEEGNDDMRTNRNKTKGYVDYKGDYQILICGSARS